MITAQLVRSENGEVLWANRYERSVGDVLSLENELVGAIVREVHGTITPEQTARLGAVRPVNPAAYDAYLKGRFFFSIFSQFADKRQFDAALAQYEQAIQLDSTYAPAYAALAYALQAAPQISFEAPAKTLARQRATALRAVELDDTLPEAHAALAGVLLWNDWNWAGAEREIRRALQLNPNSIDALTVAESYSTLVTARIDEAAATSQRILALDPLNQFSRLQVGWVALFSRRYDDGLRATRNLLELYPNHVLGHMFLTSNYAARNMGQEVAAECGKIIELLGGAYYMQAMGTCVWALGVVGQTEQARRLLRAVEHPPKGVWLDPAVMGSALGGVGDIDRAIAWYQQGIEERVPNMVYMKVGVTFDPVRGDPRFQALLRKMNFPA